jgi:hypothetical protein
MDEGDWIVEMLRAVRIEADARRGVNGGERIEVFGGRRIDSGDTDHSYRFHARQRNGIRAGEAVHVLVDDVEAMAVVAAVRDQAQVDLAIDRNVGITVPHAMLVRDDSFLLHALRERLRDARRGSIPFNWGLARSLIDPVLWTTPTGIGPRLGRLNHEQMLAVTGMAAPGVVVVWGPPGTGKTETMAAGALQAWERGQALFLLANTNVAVDNLLLAFLDLVAGGSPQDGAVVRYGDMVNRTLIDRFGEQVGFDSVVRRQREPLEQDLLRIGSEIARVRGRIVHADPAAVDLEALRSDLEGLEREASVVERRYERVPAVVLKRASVVATTIHRTYLPGQLQRQADLVVVDEASMVPLPMAVYAAGLASRTVAYGGDPLQLGTISQSRSPAVRRWYATSVFLPPRREGSTKPRPILLREQYRMADPIAQLLNAVSYRPGTLLTAPVVSQRSSLGLPLLAQSLCYVDTSGWRPMATIPKGTRSRENEIHARVIQALVRHVTGGCCGRDASTAVITPYRGQARLIRRHLGRESAACVDTVHSFQGDERTIVVLDLPDGPGAPLGSFMKARGRLEEGSRLLTVGLSRAQQHLVVVANVTFLEQEAPEGSAVRRVLEFLRATGLPLSPSILEPLLPLPAPVTGRLGGTDLDGWRPAG